MEFPGRVETFSYFGMLTIFDTRSHWQMAAGQRMLEENGQQQQIEEVEGNREEDVVKQNSCHICPASVEYAQNKVS